MLHIVFHDHGFTLRGDAVINRDLHVGIGIKPGQIYSCSCRKEVQHLPGRQGGAFKLDSVLDLQVDPIPDVHRPAVIVDHATFKGTAVKAVSVKFNDLIHKFVIHVVRHWLLLRGWFARTAIAKAGGAASLSGGGVI